MVAKKGESSGDVMGKGKTGLSRRQCAIVVRLPTPIYLRISTWAPPPFRLKYRMFSLAVHQLRRLDSSSLPYSVRLCAYIDTGSAYRCVPYSVRLCAYIDTGSAYRCATLPRPPTGWASSRVSTYKGLLLTESPGKPSWLLVSHGMTLRQRKIPQYSPPSLGISHLRRRWSLSPRGDWLSKQPLEVLMQPCGACPPLDARKKNDNPPSMQEKSRHVALETRRTIGLSEASRDMIFVHASRAPGQYLTWQLATGNWQLFRKKATRG